MNSLTTYLRNVRAELGHVVWPKRSTAIQHVILIVLISAITALFIAGLDYVFTRGLSSVLY
ncbi:MAG TPA: preprotein translocase subunit SecE [Candidatus Paceibacterota bacterium]|jgi:preprotein translocase SecE subunit